MKNTQQKKGFSLLELIFVIVILGVVSSIGSSLIAQLYENYLVQRALHRVTLKTELAINQIANRLTYRIENSVISRRSNGSFTSLTDLIFDSSNQDRAVLEWIGYDNESFSAERVPGWSGYCDQTTTAAPNISTPGSNLNFTNVVTTNLAGGTVPPLAVLFSLGGQPDGPAIPADARCYGYDGNTTCIHQVRIINNRTLNTNRLAGIANTTISDHYKLAWSAYAIVATNRNALYTDVRDGSILADNQITPRSFDLELRYNYQPWAGTQFNDPATSRVTLIRNVTSFKYSELGGTLRIKLCATERIGDANSTTNISACKEKVVIR